MNNLERHPSRSLALIGASCLIVLQGCADSGEWTPQWGPGPSAAIATSVIDQPTYEAAPIAHCQGPSDEVAELGSICTANSPNVLLVADAGDVGFIVYGGDAERRSAIVVFGYYSTDASAPNHTADVRYAARYIGDVGGAGSGSVLAQIERDVALWESGDELVGSIGTLAQLGDSTCSGEIFVGVATFQWRNTTITFRFDAAWPC